MCFSLVPKKCNLKAVRFAKHKMYGMLLRGNDKKTDRREGIEPIWRVSKYDLFSVKHNL